MVQVHKQATAERPSPIARLPQKMSLPDYWISVSFFLELSWVMHMAMNATTEMATMYQAGAMALPVASMRAMEMNDAEPPKMALAKLKDSANPE